MDSHLMSGIILTVFGTFGYLFKEKLINIQNFFSDEAPIEIRRKKIEVITKVSIIAGIVFIISSQL